MGDQLPNCPQQHMGEVDRAVSKSELSYFLLQKIELNPKPKTLDYKLEAQQCSSAPPITTIVGSTGGTMGISNAQGLLELPGTKSLILLSVVLITS